MSFHKKQPVQQMANRTHKFGDRVMSLVDLRYADCGLDHNWLKCGAGVHGSFHDADGDPIINLDRFPDMKVCVWLKPCLLGDGVHAIATAIEIA